MAWGRLSGTFCKAIPLTKRPLVSVIIPCFNYGRFLAASVGSVISQDGVDLQVIVVDDCSTDETADVAAELAASDPRIEVRSHARNLGHIATYNEGLATASGDYLVLLSADDVLTPGSLARAAALLEAHPNVGFAYGATARFKGSKPHVVNGPWSWWTVWPGHDWIRARCRRGWNVIWSPEVVMRASVQRKIGGYRHNLPRSGDFEMWMRAAAVSDVGRVGGVKQACYRLHADSMTQTIHAGERYDLQAHHDAFAAVLETGQLPDAERLYDQARKGLALRALRAASRGYHRTCADDAWALDLMEFALTMYPGAPRLAQWRSLQCRRWLLQRAPAWLGSALGGLTFLERVLLWLPRRWTET